jgi:hypothetical protein
MARRGQCRCGLILTFHRTAQGYKLRCPSCGAVVRLRVKEKRRRRSPQKTVNQPYSDAVSPSDDEIDVELVPLSELSGAAPPSLWRGKRWLFVAVGGAVLLLALVGSAVWWFLS